MKVICTNCNSEATVKNGRQRRKVDRKLIQRYKCRECGIQFSDSTMEDEYKQKFRNNLLLAKCLSEGMGINACARVFGIDKKTVLERILWLSEICYKENADHLKHYTTDNIQFDELVTFEHTICKPIIVITIFCSNSRKLLGIRASEIPATEELRFISYKKYGKRPDMKSFGLRHIFREINSYLKRQIVINTDGDYTYPEQLKKVLSNELNIEFYHHTHKSRKPKRYGHGELKVGANDPIFVSNHGQAMMRDHIKRLQRTSWATTKDIKYLQGQLLIYQWYYNRYLSQPISTG